MSSTIQAAYLARTGGDLPFRTLRTERSRGAGGWVPGWGSADNPMTSQTCVFLGVSVGVLVLE